MRRTFGGTNLFLMPKYCVCNKVILNKLFNFFQPNSKTFLQCQLHTVLCISIRRRFSFFMLNSQLLNSLLIFLVQLKERMKSLTTNTPLFHQIFGRTMVKSGLKQLLFRHVCDPKALHYKYHKDEGRNGELGRKIFHKE